MRQFTRAEWVTIAQALYEAAEKATSLLHMPPASQTVDERLKQKSVEYRALSNEIQFDLDRVSPLNFEFLTALRNTKNGKEWSVLCQNMLAKNGGDYPSDWLVKVMASGIQAEAEKNWEKENGPVQCAGCNHYRVTVDEDTGLCRECVRVDVCPDSESTSPRCI